MTTEKTPTKKRGAGRIALLLLFWPITLAVFLFKTTAPFVLRQFKANPKRASIVAGVALVVVVTAAAVSGPPTEDAIATPVTTTSATTTTSPSPTTTTAPTTTTSTSTTTTSTTTTTTTLPPTTTTTLPIIGEGVYIVPDEVGLGTYRFVGYMARLDENLEIIDNALVDEGFGLMVVLEGDAYAEISGEAILYDAFGPVDPVEQGFSDGTYLVSYDIAPGRYRITPPSGRSGYWARLDQTLEIIDNDLGDGQLIVIVNESDFALTFTGTIEPLP